MKAALDNALARLKDILPQTPSQAVLALGGIFLIGVVIDAMLPYGIKGGGLSATSVPNVADNAPVTTFLPDMGMPNNNGGGQSAAGTAVDPGALLPGMMPFAPSPPITFGGHVTEVVTIGLTVGWGQIHVWINDGTGTLREISLAPQSYLQQIGCPPLANAQVNGVGFRFDPNRPNAVLYAKTITVAGVTCRLRDDEGLALWTNPTQ